MIKLTTILLAFLLFTAAKCQEPDTHTYSDSLFQTTMDSVISHKDFVIDSLKTVILQKDSYIFSLIRPDTFNLSLESNSIIINAKREGDNAWLSIIENQEKRSHLWLIDGEIQMRLAIDSTQNQTWLPEQRTITY